MTLSENVSHLSIISQTLFYLRIHEQKLKPRSFEYFLGHGEESNLRNLFSKALKTAQDQHYLTQIEQRLPKFVELDGKLNISHLIVNG